MIQVVTSSLETGYVSRLLLIAESDTMLLIEVRPRNMRLSTVMYRVVDCQAECHQVSAYIERAGGSAESTTGALE